jgi:hypothetical protein
MVTKEMILEHMKECAENIRVQLQAVLMHMQSGEHGIAVKQLEGAKSWADEIDLAVDLYKEQHREEQ